MEQIDSKEVFDLIQRKTKGCDRLSNVRLYTESLAGFRIRLFVGKLLGFGIQKKIDKRHLLKFYLYLFPALFLMSFSHAVIDWWIAPEYALTASLLCLVFILSTFGTRRLLQHLDVLGDIHNIAKYREIYSAQDLFPSDMFIPGFPLPISTAEIEYRKSLVANMLQTFPKLHLYVLENHSFLFLLIYDKDWKISLITGQRQN